MQTPDPMGQQPDSKQNDIKKNTDANDNERVDAVKTGKSKRESTQDQPADEQMYGSFEELREQKGLKEDED